MCKTDAPARPAGFTLIELVVVLAIIAALAAVVAPEMVRHAGDARTEAARTQIELFALALEAYRLDNGIYPSSDDGLAALREQPVSGRAPGWRGPYLRRLVPADPWGRPYIYQAPGGVNPGSYDLYTLGRDATTGGEGEDSDVTSWGGPVRI